MRTGRDQQSLSYPLRLPDEIQADALRLLDTSREVINLTVTALWDRLDEFATRTNTHAYKQVEEMIAPPLVHGHRQWRCEAEQAGRILRGQAERKQHFALIVPLLEQGMIQPKTGTKRAGKNRKAIKQALADLREVNSDGGNVVELQSLIEQACNFYFQHGCFPDTYEDMQGVPLLKAGLLPYAGDDGHRMGQTYRLLIDLDQKTLTLALRTPDEQGTWTRTWRENTIQMSLSDIVVARARAGKPLAPGLREIVEADGRRYAVLDFIVEVPVEKQATFEEMHTVLGFDWGAWLCCSNPKCLWNGSRDYAASLNIARLGAALCRHAQTTGKVVHPSILHSSVQPVSYMGTRAALRLPPLAPWGHLIASGRIYCNGWRLSVRLRSSYATPIMLRLCG